MAVKNRLKKVRLADIDQDDTAFMSRLDFEENIKPLAEDIRRFGQRNPIGIRGNEGGLQVIYARAWYHYMSSGAPFSLFSGNTLTALVFRNRC